MSNPNYSFVLIDSSGNKYEFEKATNRSWERYENDVGKCRFSIPHNDNKIVSAVFESGKTKIFIYRDNVLVWQGLVASTQDNVQGTTVFGLDYKECLKWYRVGFNTTYTSKKIGTEIVSPIFTAADARTGAAPGDLFALGTIEDPYTTSTTTAKTITRTTFDEDFFSLLQEMVYVSRSNSPASTWVQNTVFDITISETAPTFTFLRNVGVDKPNVVFTLDSEIIGFDQVHDFRFIRNDIKGYSIISGPSVINSSQADATSVSSHYLREFAPSYGGITTQGELDERAKDELKSDKDHKRILSVSFASGLIPFDGYVMGDNVKVVINRGRVAINEYMRVVGMLVDIDDTGAELTRPLLQEKRT